jgi:hypothetical protein
MKSIAVGILFIISMLLAASIGYDQGQYNLYVRQCIQSGGHLFEESTPCIFPGRVNAEKVRFMNMLCDDPARAYTVEGVNRWRHYCE